METIHFQYQEVQVPDGYLLAGAVVCFGLAAIGILLLVRLFESNRRH